MTAYANVVSMAAKFREAEEKVSRQCGEFYLFGLFERERSPGRWDLVASAPWLKTDYEGTQEIIALLRNHTEIEDWKLVTGVFPLEPSVDFVKWITQRYHLEHRVEEVYNVVLDGITINRAFIITANPQPARMMPQPVAA